MIREIAEAAVGALAAEFGDHIPVNPEPRQDGAGPCFFVACICCTQDRESARRSRRGMRFCISYVPGQEGGAACYDYADRLFQCLEQLNVNGDRYRGAGRRAEFTGNKLDFYVDYNCLLQSVVEETAFGEMRDNVKPGIA